MSAKERKITAYHEGGHALVAASLNHTDPVTKVTILPRGRALGYTMVMPLDDKYSTTRNEILDQLAYALGGRVAEEIVFHDPTTGASNDIEKATGTARAMVTEFGMSERIGAIKLGQSDGEVFLGRDMGHQRDYSEEIAAIVDAEVRGLIEAAHDEAYTALNANRDTLDTLVLELLERETLNAHELAELFKPITWFPPMWAFACGVVQADHEAGASPDLALVTDAPAQQPAAGAHPGRDRRHAQRSRPHAERSPASPRRPRPEHGGEDRRGGLRGSAPPRRRAPRGRDHRGAGRPARQPRRARLRHARRPAACRGSRARAAAGDRGGP